MIVQPPPDAPLVLKAAAATLLWLHIGGAAVSLASGTVSVLARKGGPTHRAAGRVFFAAMLAMTGAAAATAPFLPDRLTGMGAVFAFYMTGTAWTTVRRPPEVTGTAEVGLFLLAAGAVAAYAWLAAVGAASPRGLVDGQQPYSMAIAFGLLTAFAAGLDLRVILRGGLGGAARISRHLWRMCLALFMVWGSFAGQPKAQPEALRGEPALFLPALACLALMAFWLVRLRWLRRRGPALAV